MEGPFLPRDQASQCQLNQASLAGPGHTDVSLATAQPWGSSATGCWATGQGSRHRTILKELNKRRAGGFSGKRRVRPKPKLTHHSPKIPRGGLRSMSGSPLRGTQRRQGFHWASPSSSHSRPDATDGTTVIPGKVR